METTFDQYLEQIQQLDPIYLTIIGIVIVLLIGLIIFSVIRSGKQRRAEAVAPHLILKAIQVAPLGKGIQVKLSNRGKIANIQDLQILKRNDLVFTKNYGNQNLETDQTLALFIEAEGRSRTDNGFDLQVSYQDQLNNEYQQKFHIHPKHKNAESARVRKYA